MAQEIPRREPRDKIRQDQLRRNQAAIQLLNYWSEHGDGQEQAESLACLKQAMGEDLSEAKFDLK